ncbi:MAG: secretin N-terminal domain-containing protein [Fuerstiella sp.]
MSPIEDAATARVLPPKTVEFSFDGIPWRDVIQWLADSGDLSLHITEVPTGSFTYFDRQPFTPQEAIDRVNLFLLPEGFTLIRTGELLSVVNLTDRRSAQQLDALAPLVERDQLEKLNSHQVVKCLFPLTQLDPDEALEELQPLNLMTSPSVFAKTKQLMIVDSVEKLRSVQKILDAFEPSTLDNGTVVKSFSLKHVDAEDVLVVARPHLGLATGEMIGIDVSISADVLGKNLFVTGFEDKVKLIEGLVASIDQPDLTNQELQDDAVLQSYLIAGGNVESIYNVLQTLLADETVRLSMDQDADSIVALGSEKVQAEIRATVEQLQAGDTEFAVISLKVIDASVCVSLLDEMLDLADSGRQASAGIDRRSKLKGLEGDEGQVRIDADPVNRRLFVRGKKHQVEEVRRIVLELDDNGRAGSADTIRTFPLTGTEATKALETAARFWEIGNPIFFYAPNSAEAAGASERVLTGDLLSELPPLPVAVDATHTRVLTKTMAGSKPAIRCQLTNQGLLMQCEDSTALDELETLLTTIAGRTDAPAAEPVVFYLKYTKADAAIRMLADLLDGGEAARDATAGGLVSSSMSDAFSTFIGSIVTGSDGTMTLIADTITVVADPRLNRLIAQGTTRDIERIESYLTIIDKDRSMTDVRTYGTSRVIELHHSKATEVAAVLREAYGDRVSGGGKGSTGKALDTKQIAAIAAQVAKSRTSGKSGGGGADQKEPGMTIAVHEPSNSLIVTAPEQLLSEVETLVALLDERNRKAVRIIELPKDVEFELLQSFLSGETPVTGAKGRSKR